MPTYETSLISLNNLYFLSFLNTFTTPVHSSPSFYTKEQNFPVQLKK